MLSKKSSLLLLALVFASAQGSRAASALTGESSAFLKAYVDSPVEWMPWGEAAIARAKSEKKPVFLFVGSFTNELAGAMRRQTFANPKSADWLNKNFVCVIVDRDERPDVAELYASYVSNLKQLNGWPLNVFLTPEFQPYEGATYLSPSEDWGAPGFLKLANQALNAWTSNPAACRKRSADSIAQLTPIPQPAAPPWTLEKSRARLAADAEAWLATYDPAQPGFGDAPKTADPELLRFLLLQKPADKEAALKTLRQLATSAVRDPLDGGFFRHASDAAWRIPYQQKTLTDQARVALAFLAGAQGDDAKSFAECARGALDFALSRLAHPDGTLAAALDATGDEYVGYYAWTEAEIDAALGADSAAFKEAHGVQRAGNVPSGDDPSALFANKNLLKGSAESTRALSEAAAKLLAIRDRRPAPLRDERAPAGAYGLLINALCRAGTQLEEPRYLDAARRILDTARRDFLVTANGELRRFSASKTPGYPGDYAALALGCRGYARAAKNTAADELADRLLAQLDARYFDPASATYFAAANPPGGGFFIRPYAATQTPSVEGLALLAKSQNSKAISAALLKNLDDSSPQAPGDQLLALSILENRDASR